VLNTACSVDHECRIGDFAQIAPGARIGGNTRVGEGAFIGIGASVIQGRYIGEWSTIGAGAAVVRDIPGGVIAYGVPARPRA
jgi:acetyltransferase-like isoleucine patch superfamily enzyme